MHRRQLDLPNTADAHRDHHLKSAAISTWLLRLRQTDLQYRAQDLESRQKDRDLSRCWAHWRNKLIKKRTEQWAQDMASREKSFLARKEEMFIARILDVSVCVRTLSDPTDHISNGDIGHSTVRMAGWQTAITATARNGLFCMCGASERIRSRNWTSGKKRLQGNNGRSCCHHAWGRGVRRPSSAWPRDSLHQRARHVRCVKPGTNGQPKCRSTYLLDGWNSSKSTKIATTERAGAVREALSQESFEQMDDCSTAY